MPQGDIFMKRINVTIWNEREGPLGSYPNGIHNAIAEFLMENEEFAVRTATLPQPEHGLTEDVLDNTDVLVYWAHRYHDLVDDVIVERIRRRVIDGMGFVALHSAHASKIFSRLMGTDTKNLRWRESGELERVWSIEPFHPIANGVSEYFNIPHSEMYGELFNIPTPDELVFISWYEGGEVFRSGCTFKRGGGKIFYFSPGHEAFPIYYMPEIKRIITNSVRWAAQTHRLHITTGHVPEFIGRDL